jgi:uncharacterized protein involved in outer membrane biogenesis
MRVRTVLLVVFGGIVAALGAATAVLSTMGFDRYRAFVADQVEAATGRKVTITGHLRLSLFPIPAFKIKDVSLANAPWGSRPEMATFGTLSAQVELLPLVFGGKVHIAHLSLKNVDLLLETDGKGRANWEFIAAAAAMPGQTAGTTPFAPPSIGSILLEDIRLAYRDGRSGETTSVTLGELSTSGAPDAPVPVKASATVRGTPVQLTATLGALAALAAGGPYPIDASFEAAGGTLTLKGSAREPLAGRGLAFDVTLDGKDLAALGALARAALPAQPYHLAAKLSGDAGTSSAFKALSVSLGASSLSGDASVTLSGERPRIIATLDAPLLDLTGLRQPKPAARPIDDGRVFSSDPWPLAALGAVDADLTLRVAALKTGKRTLRDLSAHVTLEDRELSARPFAADLDGGHIAGGITLSARAAPATLALDLDGRQIDVGRIVADLAGEDLLEAKGDLALAIRGAGGSMRAVMASLDGTSSLMVGRGVIKSRYAELLGADLLREAFTWAQGRKDSKLNCLVARFDFHKGVATVRGLLMDTADVSMLGTGTVDLGTERLAIELVPHPKDTSLLALGVPIDVAGTLEHPTLQPNKAGAAKELALGAAIWINPLTALGALVLENSGGEGKSACAAALEGAKASAAKKSEGGIGGAVKDLGQKLESLFK